MNYMEQAAKMLGVELGEKFALEAYGSNLGDFKFENDGLYAIYDGGQTINNNAIALILTGDLDIVKKPWKPIKGEEFYLIVKPCGAYKVEKATWYGTATDYMCLATGNYFKTKDEAKAAIPWFAENVERMEWDEPWEAKRNEL